MEELVTTFHSTAAGKFHQGGDAHHKTDQGEASLDGSDVGKADFCRGREFMQALMFGPEREFWRRLAELGDGLMDSRDDCDEN